MMHLFLENASLKNSKRVVYFYRCKKLFIFGYIWTTTFKLSFQEAVRNLSQPPDDHLSTHSSFLSTC